MIKTNRIISLLGILLIFVSCKKKPANEIDEHIDGSWRHYYGENWYFDLTIQKNSRGELERYENGMTSGTFKFKWLIKNNKLYHGWLCGKRDAMEINKYPTIADTIIINNFDTILDGRRYIILDGNYYVD